MKNIFKMAVFSFLVLLILTFAVPSAHILAYDGESDATESTANEQYYDDEENDKVGSWLDEGLKKIINISSYGINSISSYLKNPNQKFAYINAGHIMETLYKVFLPVGYAVFIISWAIGLAKSSVTLELTEKNEFIKNFALLPAGALLISSSKESLRLIDAVFVGISEKIMNSTNSALVDEIKNSYVSYSEFKENGSFIAFFSYISQFINYARAAGYIFKFDLLLSIFSVVVGIILGIRAIKIAIYQGVAPVFLGLYGGRETQKYTRNFFIQYIIISMQIVVISVLFSALQLAAYQYYLSLAGNGDIEKTGIFIGYVLMFVFIFMIMKSDKLFDKVLQG